MGGAFIRRLQNAKRGPMNQVPPRAWESTSTQLDKVCSQIVLLEGTSGERRIQQGLAI